ncbi:MAG TPA: MFS transporter [Dehalococcoidia bacterium]
MSTETGDPPPAAAAPRGEALLVPGTGGLFRSLRHRDFRLVWLGLIPALTGFWIQNIAQGWLAYELTGSASFLGLVAAGSSIPMLFLSLLGGVIADRVNRKRLLVITRSLIAAMAFALATAALAGYVRPWHLLAFAVGSGIAYSFDLPTRQAVIRQLVPPEDLANAVALTSSMIQAAGVAGPALGGVLLGLVGAEGCFYLTAAGHLSLVGVLLFTRIPSATGDHLERSILSNLAEGLDFIRRSEAILLLMVLAAIPSVLGGPYISFLPIFATEVLGQGESGYGWLMAATMVGAVTGSLIIAAVGNTPRKAGFNIGGAVAFGLVLVLFALSSHFYLSLVLLAATGVARSGYATMNNAMVQLATPDEYQGRVMSAYMITWNLQPVGALLMGAAADAVGVQAAVAAAGVLTALAVTALAAAKPVLRSM